MSRAAAALAFAVWWGWLLAGAGGASAQPRGGLMVDAYVRTRACMASAGRAALARGGDEARVRYFMASVCGGPFLAFLRVDMPETDAQEVVLRMTRTAYYEDVLRLREPPEKR